jgi:hypothetical protein
VALPQRFNVPALRARAPAPRLSCRHLRPTSPLATQQTLRDASAILHATDFLVARGGHKEGLFCFRVMALTINFGPREFPRLDAVVEQDVQLAVTSPFRLWEPEKAPYPAEHAGAEPEETASGSPAPGERGDHTRGDGVGDYAGDVVGVSSEHDGLGLGLRVSSCTALRGKTEFRHSTQIQRGLRRCHARGVGA